MWIILTKLIAYTYGFDVRVSFARKKSLCVVRASENATTVAFALHTTRPHLVSSVSSKSGAAGCSFFGDF